MEREMDFIWYYGLELVRGNGRVYLSKVSRTGSAFPLSSKKLRETRPPRPTAGSHQKTPLPRLSGTFMTTLATASRNSACPSGVSANGPVRPAVSRVGRQL